MVAVDRIELGGIPWWCALPDVAPAGPGAATFSVGTVAARHPSGRPWLITSSTVRLAVTRNGVTAVAVLGDAVSADLCPSGTVGEWMSQVGSAHVVATEPGRMRAIADASGFRRVFTAMVAGIPVAASHAQILRRLLDAPVDPAWLAAKLASPEMPSVLREARSPFNGVRPVPAGCVAELDEHTVRLRAWWRPPEPAGSLTAGARLLAEALTRAVRGRTDRDPAVSVQLSGGLDSTTLALLAAESAPLLVTTAGASPFDDDLAWARRVARAIPAAEHRVFGVEEMPAFFAELDRGIAGMDEPCSFTAGAARQRHAAAVLAERGSRLHLNGQGGDEVLLAPWSYLPGLLRCRPRRAWRHLRGFAALRGLRTATVLHKALAQPVDFPGWLHRAAGGLRQEVTGAAAVFGWEAPPMLPRWASDTAAELAATAIADAPRASLHPDIGVHAAVARIRASAYRAALYADAMTAAGAPTVMPFFDHDVLNACLSTRPEERTDPWQPKPLLRKAVQDTMPPELLARRTKGHYNTDLYQGWRTHRREIRELLADSRLVGLGLVDRATLLNGLDAFGANGIPPAFVTDLVALELWLDHQPPPLKRGDRRPVVLGARPRPARRGPVRLGRAVATAPVSDGLMVIDHRRGRLAHLNASAAVMLEILLSSDDQDSAVATVGERFGISGDVARADLAALVGELTKRQLVRP